MEGGAGRRLAAAKGACVLVATLLSTPALGLKMAGGLGEASRSVGRVDLRGSMVTEFENYEYSSGRSTQERQRLKEQLGLDARGAIWDPRFATYDAGITLSRETAQQKSLTETETRLTMLGYRFNSSWLTSSRTPLSLYASRTQNTVADAWGPSYALTNTLAGARLGFESKWLGRLNLSVENRKSESDRALMPRSDNSLSYGFEGRQKILQKKFGESDLGYGYRRNEWSEKVQGTRQLQDYFYLNDHTLLGDKARLSANATYYRREDQWSTAGLPAAPIASSYFNANSQLNIQQSPELSHYYSLSVNAGEIDTTRTNGYAASGGFNYRLAEQWQASGMFAQTASHSATAGVSQSSSSTMGSGGLTYGNSFGPYLVNGGYALSWQSTRLDDDQLASSSRGNTTTAVHTAHAGYTRTGSPRYADSLQLRLSRTLGSENQGSEYNARYSVTSQLGQKDTLQGVAEYRFYSAETQTATVIGSTGSAYATTQEYRNLRLDLGWLHRFTTSSSLSASVGMTNSRSETGQAGQPAQPVDYAARYAQAWFSAIPLRNLQWTARARLERFESTISSYAGSQRTIESDLTYRIGKWQATARYRFRDAQTEVNPFKEQSIFITMRRDFGFRF